MTRRRPTARRTPARGGQQGYEPPVTRMRRDERILDLALERWSQRQIAAEVGLTQAGVSKALRRILTRQLATLTEEGEAYRTKLVLLAERRARAAREGHARSQADVTTRRQRKVAAGGGAAATTVVELDTQSAAGNPTYLAVEQRCDEFAAHLVGVYEPPRTPRGRAVTVPRSGHRSASASSAASRQTSLSVPMQNSPDLLTSALQNPTLLEAELGRRRARDGTDGDVLAWIEATFGVHIPAVACCPGHVAPAQAFCDALRARASVALWIASRGFGGKTFLLALLAAANAILFETDVIILGGSGQQSLRVVEQLHGLWAAGQIPPAWLASAPTFTKTTLAWGNMIQALTASQTAVRGAHPTRLLLDEIDEMKLPILEAAQGQPMDRNGVQAQTVMSSTHQYPDGTVTAMRCRAAELDWPVYEWCYRETLKPHGWLTADQVERKRRELSRTIWAVEYELQEPSAEGRAIHPAAVERMFDADRGTHIPAGDLEHRWRGQPGPPAERAWPDPAGAWYCTGIDWAQKRDDTVAVVVRCDTTPLQVVAVYRAQRRSWQVMTEHVGALLDEYPGPAAHDATGGGNAMGEFPALAPHDQLQGVTLVGRVRTDLFRNDIGAIERHEIVCPRIDAFYTEHLYCGEDDLFGSGHPPDTVVAMALAYHAFKTGRQPGDYGVTL